MADPQPIPAPSASATPAAPAAPVRVMIDAGSRPALPRYVRLRHDTARSRWVILAPERVFNADEIAVAVLQLCDGTRSVDDIAGVLAGQYQAPHSQILSDIVGLLQDLSDRGVVKA